METMFCNQCQEAAGGTGCTRVGVCGKKPDVAKAQDLLVWLSSKLAAASNARCDQMTLARLRDNLFITITNANFDLEAILKECDATAEAIRTYDPSFHLEESEEKPGFFARLFKGSQEGDVDFITVAERVALHARTDNEDIRSLRELLLYGLKGLAAYMRHAAVLGEHDDVADAFLVKGLAALVDDSLDGDALTALVLECGGAGVQAMAALDKANTEHYGNPEITEVSIAPRSNPAILISGHDLRDMEMLLEQTKGTGVDVYTHSEMLPANYYPAFKKYDHFVGNYGNAWWKQQEEFEAFGGPILMTTNCIVPPRASYEGKLFTTGVAGWPGAQHIEENAEGTKDFSPLIAMAKTCPAPKALEEGSIVGGFAHAQTLALADKVIEAVKSGAVKKFVVMAGCDGRQKARSYYTDFAKALPEDTIILTAGCAKYRYNKLNLGDIGGIPRVLDAGQCNDSYSLVRIALALKDAFGLDDVNDLPIIYNIAWYEQKAVIVLLALLSLGVKNIHLGPTLPAFLSPNVATVLVENFGIAPNGTVEDDIQYFFGE